MPGQGAFTMSGRCGPPHQQRAGQGESPADHAADQEILGAAAAAVVTRDLGKRTMPFAAKTAATRTYAPESIIAKTITRSSGPMSRPPFSSGSIASGTASRRPASSPSSPPESASAASVGGAGAVVLANGAGISTSSAARTMTLADSSSSATVPTARTARSKGTSPIGEGRCHTPPIRPGAVRAPSSATSPAQSAARAAAGQNAARAGAPEGISHIHAAASPTLSSAARIASENAPSARIATAATSRPIHRRAGGTN